MTSYCIDSSDFVFLTPLSALFCLFWALFLPQCLNNSSSCIFMLGNDLFQHVLVIAPQKRGLKWRKRGVYTCKNMQFWLFQPFLRKKANFSHFCWSGGYSLYETRIGKCLFRLKWGVDELRTTNRSWDIEFWLFQPFFAKKANFSHFYWSGGYTLYETRIGKCLFRLKCGVNELRTTNRSWDIEFWLFQPFFAKNANFSHVSWSGDIHYMKHE